MGPNIEVIRPTFDDDDDYDDDDDDDTFRIPPSPALTAVTPGIEGYSGGPKSNKSQKNNRNIRILPLEPKCRILMSMVLLYNTSSTIPYYVVVYHTLM